MLQAKLHVPAINKNIISREKLLQKFRDVPEHKLMLVTAPAGYGKTTAVLDWLEKCGLENAWLSLDAGDNNPVTFWQYICTALDSIAEGISKETEYVFASRELMQANIHINILIDRLAKVQSDFLLVLDDLHLVTDPSIMEGLSYLIDYQPKKMHMVFISRTEPEMQVARHKLKWQIQHLDEKDLRFGEDEIFSFYQARGITLGNNDVKKVRSYTEGWVAALVAVSMSMESGRQGHDAIANLETYSGDIGHYLNNEVLRIWSPEKVNFAIKTSILDTLSEDVCNAITGYNNGRRLLEEIYEGSGFLIALDSRGRQYRYHYLFKSFLNKLLSETAQEEITSLHVKAGFWFREHGMMPEAIEHLLNGGSYQEAFELIENRIDHLIRKNDFDRLLPWIERLPEEYRDNSFKIAVIYALYYAETDRLDLSRRWVDRMKLLREKQQQTSSPEWNHYSKTVAILTEANLLVREGNIQFLALLVTAAENNKDNAYKMPEYNDFNMADIYYYRSPISVAAKLFGKAPEQHGRMIDNYRGMISKNPGYAPLGIGEYYYESNRLEEAIPYLLKAIEEAQAVGCPGALVPAMVDFARIKRAKGDLRGALEVVDKCENKLQSIGKSHWIYLINAFRCRLNIDAGDAGKVDEWLASCKQDIFAEVNKIREFELIIYARLLMSKGKFQEVKVLLQKLLAFTEAAARLHSRVEILNLLAMLDYKNNDTASAVNYLESSLAIGLKEGYVRSYLDEFTPMARILNHYTTRRSKQTDHPEAEALLEYGKNLLRLMRENAMVMSDTHGETAAAGLEKLLTEAEKKVLELLLEASTNQEIATQLGVSLRTAKTHIGSIYSKLGVKTRIQCVKLIRETGLLE